MNKTITQKACMHLHVESYESNSKFQLSVIGKLKKECLIRKASVFGFSLLLSSLFCFLPFQQVVAQTQNITVKGKVLDADDNTTLPSVSLVHAATKKVLGQTNNDGEFTITVAKGSTVNFSMLGYSLTASTFSTAASNVVIKMKASSSTLNQVVVTALGIKREERALGYSVTTVDSTQLTNAIASNWTDALSGKVAGLNLVRSGGPAGSNKIILRGENNLTGDNEALIVIDGVVASSSAKRSASTGGGAYGSDIMPVDFGSGINDLEPDEIESVSVLKGPAAAALYGQRGANGAIVITTKSATKNRKTMGINFTSNSSWEDINRGPDRQSEFGAGSYGNSYFSYGTSPDGVSTNSTSGTYGPAFGNGAMYYQFDPVTKTRGVERTPWIYRGNPVDDFFITGFESRNTLSLDGTFKKVGLRLAASHGSNEWIVPNTGLERTSVSLNANTNLTKKLTLNVKMQYSNRHSDNLPATGYGNQSLMYWFMFSQPNVDTDWYRDYWAEGMVGRRFVNITTTFPESPYAISEQYINSQRRNGWLGNAQLTYKFTKNLSLMVRASGDLNNDTRETLRPWDTSGAKYAQGSYRTSDISSYEINADFMLKYDKKLSKNLRVTTTAGGSQMRNEYNKFEQRADGLIEPGVYRLTNNQNPLILVPDTSRYRINSFYGAMSFSYKKYLYLDLTARQDWNSTLATETRTDNVGFFYPSASLSFIASDYWKLPKAVSLAKLRASIAQVGSGSTTPYRTAYNYAIAADGVYPDSAMNNPKVLPNPNLKPLITTTVELGLDLKLFKNRLNLDVAVYSGNTKNQILNRIVDRSTGYNVQVVNIGRVDNKGVEVALNGTPVKTRAFKWTLNSTFSANRNEIKELADTSVVLRTGALGGGQVIANVGGSMGDIYGRGYLRSPDGQIIFDERTGVARENTQDLFYLGNTVPQFRFGLGSGITYKQLTVNALFDAQIGAVGHSLTFARMAGLGKLNITLPGRYNGVTGPGVVEIRNQAGEYTGTYRPNDVIATDIAAYYESIYGSNQAEGSIFRTDFIKFREANINYAFNKKFLKRIGFSKMTLGVYGRNLFIWSPWPAFDPEFGTLSGTDIEQGFETGQLPSTRTFGARLVVGI